MQLYTVFLSLASIAAALPTEAAASGSTRLQSRQSAQVVTDQLLFSISLPAFEARRNARDPPTLDWISDGCTSSPDNPFGFPFIPACHRHDFGYHNYRAQSRFTVTNKGRIDSNFKTDLYYQCSTVTLIAVCRALADVYYAAVVEFGGDDATPGKRYSDYEEKVAIYEQLVKEAQEQGLLPTLEYRSWSLRHE